MPHLLHSGVFPCCEFRSNKDLVSIRAVGYRSDMLELRSGQRSSERGRCAWALLSILRVSAYVHDIAELAQDIVEPRKSSGLIESVNNISNCEGIAPKYAVRRDIEHSIFSLPKLSSLRPMRAEYLLNGLSPCSTKLRVL